jgi:hypothetical protein
MMKKTTTAINQWRINDVICSASLGGESNASSSLLHVPALLLVQIKNECGSLAIKGFNCLEPG